MPGTPSVEELCERLAQRDELIAALSAELGAARVRIAELEARLGQTSKNSSKPPSSDGLDKPAPKSLRRRGVRKPGGQDGHRGSTLAPVATPDEVITHEPVCCRGCGDGLGGAPEVGREHRGGVRHPPDARAGQRASARQTALRPRSPALCGAHVLRELQAVTDLAPEGQWCWATQAGDALCELNQLVNDALAVSNTLENIDPAALSAAVHRYRSAALLGVQATGARSGKLMGKHNALAHRLIDRQDDYLRFTRDPRVPFDNNAAEREIRMIKLRQKVSGCLRTVTGAGQFCAIRSYLATAAKHGIHFFAALTTLAEGHPWLPEPPNPSRTILRT